MTSRPALRVPKILGADVELGNFIDGIDSASGSGCFASRLLLAQIPGVPSSATSAVGRPDSHQLHSSAHDDESSTGSRHTGYGAQYAGSAQDWGRRFLPGNGGCAYIDLDHLELALPETFSAFDHVIYWRAMLNVARAAVIRANRRLPDSCQVHALVNCSDGHGHSYGAHNNVLLTRPAWESIVQRKPHYLAYLAAFQVSAIVFTGAGKVGSENGRPWADYQLTQRGDFLETMLGEQTTYHRPIINARNEPLCGGYLHSGGESDLARLHVIFFDATLCQVATLLRVGTLQIVTSMLEAECVPPALALDDPLDALQRWGHDPSLSARSRLVSGEAVTAVELQRRFMVEARRFGAVHGFDGIVPRAAQILDLWEDTLIKLNGRDFLSLGRRLDWVLKQQLLERAMAARPGLTWSSAQIRHLDQMYGSVDEREGLFWACERAGLVDVIVSEDEIRRAMQEAPEDTRAWTRSQLLRRAGAARIGEVDWDRVGVRLGTGQPRWGDERRTVHLPRPFEATKADNAELFSPARSINDIVESLAPETASFVAPVSSKFTVC